MIDFAQALKEINQVVRGLEDIIVVPLDASQGKVLAENIVADRDIPPFHRSAMDGLAFPYEKSGSCKNFKIKSEILAGMSVSGELEAGEAYLIMTGAAVPLGCSTVIPIENFEYVESSNEYLLREDGVIKDKSNIHYRGSDATEKDILIESGCKITAAVMGVMAAVGKSKVQVVKPPRIHIISTGDEVIPVDEVPNPVQIRDVNSHALSALASEWGDVKSYGILRDDKELLYEKLRESLDCDVLLLTGGVSAGTHDFIPEILKELGIENVFHKVAIKPGKPIWFGKSMKGPGPLVFGLPGNPVSAQVGFHLFVAATLRKLSGDLREKLGWQKVRTANEFYKKHGRHEFSPGYFDGDKVERIKTMGSGDFFSYSRANCLISYPGGKQITFSVNEEVEILMI